jgi:hypothetical protein
VHLLFLPFPAQLLDPGGAAPGNGARVGRVCKEAAQAWRGLEGGAQARAGRPRSEARGSADGWRQRLRRAAAAQACAGAAGSAARLGCAAGVGGAERVDGVWSTRAARWCGARGSRSSGAQAAGAEARGAGQARVQAQSLAARAGGVQDRGAPGSGPHV